MKKKVVLVFVFSIGIIFTLFAQGRKVKSFNDGWQFKKGSLTDSLKREWENVEIPHTWNAKDMMEKHNDFYEGPACYKKIFFVEEELKGKRIFIKFEGVGQVTKLYVNEKFVGVQMGGYSAFAYDLSRVLKYGEDNEIMVMADNSARPDVIPINHSLFGVYGGIYRQVWLIITEPINIAVTDYASPGVYISQKNVSSRSADVNIKVKIDNKKGGKQKVIFENSIYDANDKLITRKQNDILLEPTGEQIFDQDFKIKKPHLWNGRLDPYLYKVVTCIKQNGKIIDEVIQPLGLRNYEIIAGDGFYLNGKKYPMYGVTRHQDWWGMGSALKNEHHDFDLDVIMDVGATTVRFAHYQQSDYLYSRCDTLGLIIWAEIPFVNKVSTEESANAKEQLRELIRQGFNHPSIYIWGLHNEVYHPHEYTANLTRELHDLAKTEDPGRYTVAVNGYGTMEHPVNLNADIQGMNRYFGWYEKTIQDIKPWVEDLKTRYPDYKLMLTEYGADANIHHQTEYIGESLNWTKEYYPETFQTKTHEYQWSIIAENPYIIASYLWNMFDFAVPMWKRGGVEGRNMKGLVTIDRKVKKDSYFWYKANWSKEPVIYITQRRLKDREKQVTNVTVYSNMGEPQLYLNGERVSNPVRGYTDVHYIFENVKLKKGENILKTFVVKDSQTYEDEIEWVFTNEKKAGEAETLNNPDEHWGF